MALLVGTYYAWEVDDSCLRRNRQLKQDIGMFKYEEEDAPVDISIYDNLDAQDLSVNTRRLRGTDGPQKRRALQSSFQLKLYWESRFCWQEERIERKWCMSCIGSSCEKGEDLWLQFCDAEDVTQKFKYLPIEGTEGGQLQTVSNNLCLERVSRNNFTLADCSASRVVQVLTGLVTDGRTFELKPYGAGDLCLNQEHYPKAGEVIKTTTCDNAREYNTNLWTVYHGGSESSPYSASDLSTLRLKNNTNFQCGVKNPCKLCQGSCSSDFECGGDMRCFRRDGNEPVPGCYGPGIFGEGYCYDPLHSIDTLNQPRISLTGCSKENPCRLCEGDCRSDMDCVGNLVCQQKQGPGTVDGCSGFDPSNSDFCVEPRAQTYDALPLGKPGCSVNNPCGLCEGDCDNDDECAGQLVCKQKNGPGSVDGCLGFDQSKADFCVEPLVAKAVIVTNTPAPVSVTSNNVIASDSGNNSGTGAFKLSLPGCSVNTPCGLCEGDCDNDDECGGHLVCRQKSGPGSVDGCAGYDKSNSDFCVEPPVAVAGNNGDTNNKSAIIVGKEFSLRLVGCTADKPCGLCEGDCDSDADCGGDLVCAFKSGPGFIEGCSGFDNSSKDFCVKPHVSYGKSASNTVNHSGGHLLSLPGCSVNTPCGLCEGGCNNDDECGGHLVCRQKSGPGSVDGCLGWDESNSDFCVEPPVASAVLVINTPAMANATSKNEYSVRK